jgi:succinoglycan biosynthesis protein ExoM
MTKQYDMSVCICTYKRPELLWRTLSSIANQSTSYTYEVVVVDNDKNQTAQNTCERARIELFDGRADLLYLVEPKQNISLARNKAIRHAKSRLIAMIDDDETAADGWLDSYAKILFSNDWDYAVGPVRPVIPDSFPDWLVRGGLFHEKDIQKTEAIRACTNNVCFKGHCLYQREGPFEPRYGKTGGEDAEFGAFIARRGFCGVWCHSAIVYETQQSNRRKVLWHIKRGFQHGLNHSDRLTQLEGRWKTLCQISVRSIGGILRAVVCYVITFYKGRASLLKLSISLARQFGRISYFFGIRKRGYR